MLPSWMEVAESFEVFVSPFTTVMSKYFLTTVPAPSLTFMQIFFVPVPVNLIETEDVEEKSCFVVHVEAEEAL